jgi:hypothetical protein
MVYLQISKRRYRLDLDGIQIYSKGRFKYSTSWSEQHYSCSSSWYTICTRSVIPSWLSSVTNSRISPWLSFTSPSRLPVTSPTRLPFSSTPRLPSTWIPSTWLPTSARLPSSTWLSSGGCKWLLLPSRCSSRFWWRSGPRRSRFPSSPSSASPQKGQGQCVERCLHSIQPESPHGLQEAQDQGRPLGRQGKR